MVPGDSACHYEHATCKELTLFSLFTRANFDSLPGGSTEVANKSGFRSRVGRIAALVAMLAAVFPLSGCGVNVTDRTPASPTPLTRNSSGLVDAPSTAENHDVAIAAVDFDPALDPQKLVSGKPHSLLVAIENKGNRTEEQVIVTAQLLTADRQQVLMSSQKQVNLISPGNLTVVKFPGATNNLPRQRTYLLNVEIQPCPREANLANNKRTLEIQVSFGN